MTETGRVTKDGEIDYRGKLLKNPNAFMSKARGGAAAPGGAGQRRGGGAAASWTRGRGVSDAEACQTHRRRDQGTVWPNGR